MSIVTLYPYGYTKLHLEGRSLCLLACRRKSLFVEADAVPSDVVGCTPVRSQGSPSWTLHAQCDGRAKGAVEIGDKSALEKTRLGQAVSYWNWSGSCDTED